MLMVISPAKTLDFESAGPAESTQQRFKKNTAELVEVMKEKSPKEIGDLMSISEALSQLNADRYQTFRKSYTEKNAKQSMFAFMGDVYIGLEAKTLSEEDVSYAQSHLRILSGLYGLLRPLDMIQPYRLEMGTRLKFDGNNSLYDYWDDTIAKQIDRDVKAQGDKILLNLASNEYFKAAKAKTLKANVVNVEFKDFKTDKYKVISFFAKKARGLMARFVIQNKIETLEELKGFNTEGYRFSDEESTEDSLVFLRG